MADRGTVEFYRRIALQYKKYRPEYPESLFRYLASHALRRRRLGFLATGSGGQAARGLAPYFRRVIATDAVAEQIAIVDPCPGVEFRCATAELSGLDDDSVDLLTVAQATHWFDLDRFYAEVRRVVRRGGVVALWCYRLPVVDLGPIDALVAELYDAPCLTPYWPAARRHVDDGYQSLSFPFDEIRAPEFKAEAAWSLRRFLGYLGTWQAIVDSEDDPAAARFVAVHLKQIASAWKGSPRSLRNIHWRLNLRLGRTPSR